MNELSLPETPSPPEQWSQKVSPRPRRPRSNWRRSPWSRSPWRKRLSCRSCTRTAASRPSWRTTPRLPSGSSSLVPMMKPTDLGDLDDLAHLGRLDGPMLRTVHVERLMDPETVIVAEVA